MNRESPTPGPVCPKCGHLLAADAPRGLCPRCLFAIMVEGPLPRPVALSNLPRLFGSYELLEEAARGGMGIVYRAHHVQLNRIVALKVIAAGQFASTDFLARFATEAETVARLDHPNIVPIYEVGECDGQPFFSMKFIDGGSLSQWIARHPPGAAIDDTAAMMVKLARAVHYAHQRGILHRDIKPGNVMLDAQGEPFLTDFGLARLVEIDSTLTRTLAMLGTPSYMSPEQARGESRHLTTAVDVYGLGAVFYELLTGEPPFAGGTTMETVRQVLEKEPRSPSLLNRGVDRDLEVICLKCLRKDPVQRYGSAEALANDLECWARHEPIDARPPSPADRALKWIRRNKAGFAFMLAIVSLLVAALAISGWHAGVQRELRHQAEVNERQAIDARGFAFAEAELRRRQMVRMHVAVGNERVEDGDAFSGLLHFAEALRLDQGDSAREDIHRRRFAAVIHTAPRLKSMWSRPLDGLVSSRFSPDGRRIACGDETGGARIVDVETGLPLTPAITGELPLRLAWFTQDGRFLVTADANGNVRHWDATTSDPAGPILPTMVRSVHGRTYADCFDYSPDGRRLIAVLSEGVRFFSVPAGEPEGPLLASTTKVTRVRFSPDGRTALITGDRPGLQLVDVPSGLRRWAIEALGEWVRFASFSPDGTKVATASGPDAEWRSIDLWEAGRGTRMMETFQSLLSYDLQFSPDGRWLALADATDALILDVQTGRAIGDRMRHKSHISQYEFSADGKQLATASFDRTACVWDVASSRALVPALRHGGLVFEARFSPDGRRLLTSSFEGLTRLWELRGNQVERLGLAHGLAGVPKFCVSPKGERVVVFADSREVQIWNTRTGALTARRWEPEVVTTAAFSPDGSRLVVAFADGNLRVRDGDTFQDGVGIAAHSGRVTCLDFSRDGKRLLTAGVDGTSRIWGLAEGTPLTPPMGHGGTVRQAAFSADGNLVLTGCEDRKVRLWDAHQATVVGEPMELASPPMTALLNAQGNRVLTVREGSSGFGPGATQLWDPTTGRPLHPEWELPTVSFHVAAFSPDGSRFLYAHDANSVALCDALTGRRLAPLLEHRHQPGSFAFSPDGTLVMSYAFPVARIWDANTGEQVSPPLRHPTHVMWARWSPHGNEILTAAKDQVLRIWDVSPAQDSIADLIQEAELLAAQRLDPVIGMVPLSQEEIMTRWREFSKRALSRGLGDR